MPTPYTWGQIENASSTGNSYIDALLCGTKWTSKTITYSFPSLNNSEWSDNSRTGYGATNTESEPWKAGYEALQTTQQNAVRTALWTWAKVSGLEFKQVNDTASSVGDLRFAFSASDIAPDAQAWAYYPAAASYAGDVWFNRDSTNYTEPNWTKGGYEFLTVIHEIGHALGLKHPFDDTPTLNLKFDSRSYTVMSYSAFGGQEGSYFSFEPTTPMVLDIQAIQHMYGKDTSYNSGNTVYNFNEQHDYNQTIWDAGGVDTIYFSANHRSGVIDLRQGHEFGSRMGNALTAYEAETGEVIRSSLDNIYIAFGAVIENATGGNKQDTIIGNSAKNVLQGRDGSDTLQGLSNNDSLHGGNGTDKLYGGDGADRLTGGQDADKFFFNTKLANGNVDTISDMSSDRDTIVLENAIFKKLAVGDLNVTNFRANTSGLAQDGNDHIIYETDTGKLYYDANGNAAGGRVLFAILGTSDHPAVKAADFLVI